jgi:hypothetical protein
MLDPELLLSGKLLSSEDEVKAAGQIAARAYADEMKKLCAAFGVKTAAEETAAEETANEEPEYEEGDDDFTENEKLLLESLGKDE